MRLLVALFLFARSTIFAGIITFQTNVVGSTPSIVGYDSGHFYPGGNTVDWWRYSGVSGARLFVSPTEIEPSDELPPWGDGVTNQAGFINRKALVRSDPWNTNYFNWPYVSNRFATHVLTGSDSIVVDYALSNLTQLGVQVVIDATATASKFTNVVGWPDQWELWHYYYEQTFYLASQYGVQRYQMYNEPDDGGPSGTDYLTRLQLASDAIQSALADVNSMYGKSLLPIVLAPVSAGSTSAFSTYGKLIVTNRHENFLGQIDTNFSLIQKYDYHEYGSSPPNPPTFSNTLISIQNDLASIMSPDTPYPVTLTEFNVYDGSVFNGLSTTLDTPGNYSAFGAIAVNLMANGVDELYCFKLSQTVGSGYIAKNGTHYVDNTNAPHNIGGITKGGEVWRLINQGFAPGRSRLAFTVDSQTSALNLMSSYDAATQRYYILSVNNTTGSIALTANLAAWGIPTNNTVMIEAVSETTYGGILATTNVNSSGQISMVQGSNSVWLFTVPAAAQAGNQVLNDSADAQVTDGIYKNVAFPSATNLVVENNSTNTNLRSVAYVKFQLPTYNPTNLQLAVLSVNASSLNGAPNVLGYVYGITNNNWIRTNLTWSLAPNLAQGIPAGTAFTNNFVTGAGSNAFIVGQLVAGATPGNYGIDVTAFLKNAPPGSASFLFARPVRYLGDTQDNDGISIVSGQSSGGNGPKLQLYFNSVPQPLDVQQPQFGTNGIFSFNLVGPPNHSYTIQVSTNLFDWTSNSSVSNSNGSVQILLNNPAILNGAYYYRAVMQ